MHLGPVVLLSGDPRWRINEMDLLSLLTFYAFISLTSSHQSDFIS